MSNPNQTETQFSPGVAVFNAGSRNQAEIYTSFSPETNDRRVIFSFGGHPLGFYWSMTPQQAITMASHLVELAESLREIEQVAA